MFRLGVSRERYSASDSATSNRNGLLQGGSVFWKLVWLPFVVMIWISWFKFNHFSDPTFRIVSNSISCGSDYSSYGSDYCSLKGVLERASMEDKTVIITVLNEAWATPNSIFDVFLESFQRGNQTEELLKHVVVISMDQKAYERCLAVHPHCYDLSTQDKDNTTSGEVYFMTQAYLDLLWKRVNFLLSVLEHGYNFIFTDCDVIWFRNPFPRFHPHTDFQIACDLYKGGPKDLINLPNGGFTYVISNNRTVEFFKFWYASRRSFPGLHDQDVFNEIKSDPFITKIGLRIKFLDTKYFGGLCQPSKDFNQVCTMHANCCYGLENKVHDLKILLQDWTRFWLIKNGSSSQPTSWTAPQKCIGSYHPPDSPKKKAKFA